MLLELMHSVSKPGMVSYSCSASALSPVRFLFAQFGSASTVLCLRTGDE